MSNKLKKEKSLKNHAIDEIEFRMVKTCKLPLALEIECGKLPKELLCSKFCTQSLLEEFNSIANLKLVKKSQVQVHGLNEILKYLYKKSTERNWDPKIKYLQKLETDFMKNAKIIFEELLQSDLKSTSIVPSFIYVLDLCFENDFCLLDFDIHLWKEIVNHILAVLHSIRLGDSLVINSKSLFNRFNVGTICLLTKYFEEWGIISPDLVVVYSNLLTQPIEARQILHSVREELKSNSVLSFLPFKCLYGEYIKKLFFVTTS